MKNFKWYALGVIFLSAVWGYFTDLSKGNFYGFIYKIFFAASFTLAIYFSIVRAQKKYIKAQENAEVKDKGKNNKKQNNKKSSKK